MWILFDGFFGNSIKYLIKTGFNLVAILSMRPGSRFLRCKRLDLLFVQVLLFTESLASVLARFLLATFTRS